MTWLPITHREWQDNQEYYLYPHLGAVVTEADAILYNVDWLIERLYEPDAEVGARLSSKRLADLDLEAIGRESINGGDLSCMEVRAYADGSWEVTIEEAAPECPAFCAYIAEWLRKWGWQATVRTEW